MTTALTHLALHVEDIDSCLDFYQQYCKLEIVHDRLDQGRRIVWLAEPGKEDDFILVFIPGGPCRDQRNDDISHLGFALESREAVDEVAVRASTAGILEWEPRDEPYPVGYYCGVKDPDGNVIEVSFGQPLGPGAKQVSS